MSDQDLITFESDHVNGETAPEIEITPPIEEAHEKTEESDKIDEPNVVSTASIDLNISESPKTKVEEEISEVSVEFEQLDLSPVVRNGDVTPTILVENVQTPESKLIKNPKRPPNNHAAESKIAMEIREMRQREEELRLMRERVNSKPQEPPSELLQSDGSTKSEDFLEDGRGSPSINYNSKNNMTRAVSLDSLHMGQMYNIGYAFGHRRKEQIKVKPLEDGVDGENDEEVKTNYRTLKESPIEREIRQAREREDALKKEKGVNESTEHKRQMQKSTKVIKSPEQAVNQIDTQRLLATTRIQQEIEEQTRREMALRESGHIQTISEERTDSKVTKIREASSPLQEQVDRKQSPSPTVEIYEKTNGHQMNGVNKSPSPPTSSNSSVNAMPLGRRLSGPSVPGRGVSMQRFIKSKGKDIGYATFTGSGYKDSVHTDYYEIRPPQIRRVNGHLGPMAPRRSATAESKIQEELKEMKAREEELKRQRARLLGLSQPNLSSLISDSDLITNGQQEEVQLERSNSNPNLLDEVDAQETGFANGRRRSALIAQWEQRIQKAEANC